MKNCGGREGSTITAGMFLKHFVGKTPWIHLDIAGVSWFDQSNPLIPEGASGIGLRLVSNFLQCLAINDDDSIWKAKVD
jgi:leucyl aminopeptidase